MNFAPVIQTQLAASGILYPTMVRSFGVIEEWAQDLLPLILISPVGKRSVGQIAHGLRLYRSSYDIILVAKNNLNYNDVSVANQFIESVIAAFYPIPNSIYNASYALSTGVLDMPEYAVRYLPEGYDYIGVRIWFEQAV